MWIRSQDKDCLVDVIGVSIVDYYAYEDYYSKEVKYETVGISVGGKQWSLGTYNTEGKAMSVLDELQNRIVKAESGVLQMPEDE